MRYHLKDSTFNNTVKHESVSGSITLNYHEIISIPYTASALQCSINFLKRHTKNMTDDVNCQAYGDYFEDDIFTTTFIKPNSSGLCLSSTNSKEGA